MFRVVESRYRLVARTPDFHSGNSDSNSGSVTNSFYIMNIFKKIFKHITSKPIQVFTKEEPIKCLNDIAQFDDV